MRDPKKFESADRNRHAARDVAEQRQMTPRSRVMRHTLHPVSRVAVAAIRAPAGRGGKAAGLWRRFLKELFAPYRPELHYMRGPGPRWRERHGGTAER
jgi:hypothetical protein